MTMWPRKTIRRYLAVAGLTDPRVTYWEPAKWVAKLRELKTDANPALFKVHMTSGHGGASGRFSRLEEVAFSYAFAVKAAVERSSRHICQPDRLAANPFA